MCSNLNFEILTNSLLFTWRVTCVFYNYKCIIHLWDHHPPIWDSGFRAIFPRDSGFAHENEEGFGIRSKNEEGFGIHIFLQNGLGFAKLFEELGIHTKFLLGFGIQNKNFRGIRDSLNKWRGMRDAEEVWLVVPIMINKKPFKRTFFIWKPNIIHINM